MTHEAFCALVRDMRKVQVEYFRTRNQLALSKSITLERRVDLYLAEIADTLPEPPRELNLFMQ